MSVEVRLLHSGARLGQWVPLCPAALAAVVACGAPRAASTPQDLRGDLDTGGDGCAVGAFAGPTSRDLNTDAHTSGDGCADGGVCLAAEQTTRGFEFTLRTHPLAQVTLTLDCELANLTASTPLPLTIAAAGGMAQRILSLTATDARAPFSMSYVYAWGWGLNTAQHDDAAVYRLPYCVGRRFRVVQGYHGTFTHTGEEEFALDFAMPQGTLIVAARTGTVLDVIDAFDQGGDDPALKDKANRVVLVHDDGTVARYSHFQRAAMFVQRGERVEAGAQLGLSGNTGYARGPHLHFEVSRRVDGATRTTLPTRFRTSAGVRLGLEQGSSYAAVE